MFIPIAGWAGKIAKIDKIVPEELLTKMQVGLKSLKTKGKNSVFTAFYSIEKWLDIFSKGSKPIQDFYKTLADDTANWLLTNKKKFSKVNKIDIYHIRYVGRDLQPLVKSSKAFILYGRAGKNVVKAVDKTVEQILRQGLSKNKLNKDFVMVSGMIFRKGGKLSKSITKTNFTKAEIGKFSNKANKFLDKITGEPSKYQNFLDNLHPILKKRYEKHMQEVAKKINASTKDISRAGEPASHGEIRALDELLRVIDPTGKKYGDEVFKYIYGYNRFLPKIGVQPPCVHCHFFNTFSNIYRIVKYKTWKH